MLLISAIAVTLIAVPALAGAAVDITVQENTTSPETVKVGVYGMDFKKFNVAEGTVEANFYLPLKSDTPASLSDMEIINWHTTSVDTLIDAPHEKYYRIFASMVADPDLRRYPFDRHVLP